MKLSFAFAYTVSALSLPLASSLESKSSSSLRGHDNDQALDLDGPFSELRCTIEAKGDEDLCSTSFTDDDQPCSYCSLSQNGQESGLCVNPEIADQMKQLNPDVSCDGDAEEVRTYKPEDILSITSTVVASTVDGPFDDLKCLFEAKNDEATCDASVTDDGEPCSYCTTDGQDSGLCVNPDVADQMMQINKSISCTHVAMERLEFDKEDFKCTFEALNDADKCASTKTDGEGNWCEYCTMDGPFGTQGVCVSPEHATSLEGLVGDKITCVSNAELPLDEPLQSNPITDCNIQGVDNVVCLDPSQVNGSECIWCDAGIGGFCFPKEWKDKASHFMTCVEASKVVEEAPIEEENNDLDIDPSFLSSSCFKVGLNGSSPDDCRAALDDETGESCIFCNAPQLGGLGLCMTPDFKGSEGRFYTCDGDTEDFFAEE